MNLTLLWRGLRAMGLMYPMRALIVVVLALVFQQCTAGVAHTVTVVLPTPHLAPAGNAKQFGTLFFYTDRNMPETSVAFKALLEGKTTEALNQLEKIEGANLPAIQRAYWQNDVAVCFILEGRYKEADELLLQAGLHNDEDVIRHNHRVSVYLNESQGLHKQRLRPVVVPESAVETAPAAQPKAAPAAAPRTDEKGSGKP